MIDKFEKSLETIEETKELLEKKSYAFMVRPTGFGKTFGIVKISRDYDKIFYIYPRDIIHLEIKEKYADDIKDLDIEFITYQNLALSYTRGKLAKKFEDVSDINQRVLFVFDEAHIMGADKTSLAIRWLMDNFPFAYYLGATATPIRTDGFNIITEFFGGNMISKYGIKDAIDDGIYPKLDYVYSLYEQKEKYDSLKDRIEYSSISNDKKVVLFDKLNSSMIKYNEFIDIEKVIEKHLKPTPYMKIIVFYPDISTMLSKIDTVSGWIQYVYPDHDIVDTIVCSKREYKNNINIIQDMKYTENKIDIIHSINMLNYGYHVDDLSAIMMLRPTISDIIYKQQIGRALSIDSKTKPVIFDLVGNQCRNSFKVYDTISRKNNLVSEEDEYTKDCFNIIDNKNDIDEVERLIDDYINIFSDNTQLAIECYIHKCAPIKWAMNCAGVSTITSFRELLINNGVDLLERDMKEYNKSKKVS